MRELVISLFKAYCPDTFLVQTIEESITAFAEAHANAEDAFVEKDISGAYAYEAVSYTHLDVYKRQP